LRGVLIERIYFGPTTQIKLQIQENLPPIIALVANQTATKMPQLKLGDRYYAVWDASDSVLVGTDGEPAQQVNDPIRVDPTDSDSGRNGKTASSKPSAPTSVEKPQALRSRLARQT
jgi:hypothetical protein